MTQPTTPSFTPTAQTAAVLAKLADAAMRNAAQPGARAEQLLRAAMVPLMRLEAMPTSFVRRPLFSVAYVRDERTGDMYRVMVSRVEL
jgi:hypothetical protein